MVSLRAQAFYDFINEREEVRQRRLAGFSFPWTDDPILRSYKFTNVRRHHDRTSDVLRKTFYDPNFHDDPRNLLMNAALFRYFGTWEFAQEVGWQTYEDFDFKGIKDLAEQRLDNRQRVFTGAYVITNQGISAPKQEVVVDYFLKDLHLNIPDIIRISKESRSWQRVAKRMMMINGFGGTGFMTKEILLDTTYTSFWGNEVEQGSDGRFSLPVDWQNWTPIGPGARRGAARVAGDDTATPLSESKSQYIIFDLLVKRDLWAHDGELCPHDIQFQLCEFDKYERVRLGQGKPRSRYRA